jgi:hypothetical protein
VRKNTETCYLDPRLKWWNNGKLYDGVGAYAQKDPPFSLPKLPEKTTSSDAPVEIKPASQLVASVSVAPPSQNDYVSASKLLPKKEPDLPPKLLAKDFKKPPAQKKDEPRKAPQKMDKQQTSITNFFSKPTLKQEIKKEETKSSAKASSRRSASKPAAAKIYDRKPVVKKEVEADIEVIEVPLSRDPRRKSIELNVEEAAAANKANGKRKSARSDSSGSKRQKTSSSSAAKQKPTCKSSSSCKGESKSAVADKIIKLLNPHYKTGKIKSKEAFKKIARTLAHHISENNITGNILALELISA